MPSFRKVSAGQPAAQSPARSAAWLTAATQLINDAPSAQRPPGDASAVHPLVNPVKVRNLTDANRLRGDVIQVGDYLLSPFDPRNPWFEGHVYDAAEPRPIAILVKAAVEDEIIEVAISGLCVARVDVQSTSDRYAVPQDGQTALRSTSSAGAIEIISPLTTTGVQEVFVLIGGAGGSTLVLGIYVDTVPAASISVSGTGPAYSLSISHGFAPDSVIIAQKKSDNSGWEQEPDGSDARVVGGINFSFSRLRASTANPVPMLGYIETLTTSEMVEEEEVFSTFDVFVPANWDMSSLFRLNTGEIQVPYKDAATREVVLDAEECST